MLCKHCKASFPYVIQVTPYKTLSNGAPGGLEVLRQFPNVVLLAQGSNTPTKLVPKIFNGIEIRTAQWPIHGGDVVVFKQLTS